MHAPIYILGGSQTDFARNWAREDLEIYDLFAAALQEAVQLAAIEPAQIEVGHVGNFVGDLFTRQGLIGGVLWPGVPGARQFADRSARSRLRLGVNGPAGGHARH